MTATVVDTEAVRRLADVVEYAAEIWRCNDPQQSMSGTVEGIMRREGRRDIAAALASKAFGGAGTRGHGEHMLRELGMIR